MPHPSPEQLAEMREALAAFCPGMARLHAVSPALSWRTRPGGFSGLVYMIVGQQISTYAAEAVWRKMEAGLGEVTPAAVLARTPEGLRELGLSLPKARYVLAIAEAQASGRLDLDDLSGLSDAEAVAALTAIKGVGRWTAETFLMMCDGRTDVFPAGDIALQEAVRHADGLAERPSEKALYARAEAWAPYRSAAAHLAWAYYVAVREKTIPPLPAAVLGAAA